MTTNTGHGGGRSGYMEALADAPDAPIEWDESVYPPLAVLEYDSATVEGDICPECGFTDGEHSNTCLAVN